MNKKQALAIADEIEALGFSADETITINQAFDREKVAAIIMRSANHYIPAEPIPIDLPRGPGCTKDPNTCGVNYCNWPNCEPEPSTTASGVAGAPEACANEIACHFVGNNDISLDEGRAYVLKQIHRLIAALSAPPDDTAPAKEGQKP